MDGVERVVRGAHEDTTCENILLALANATGKLGRFALLEKWRDLERILPREAKPIKCLQMWGKQASEVKFVLKLMKDKSTPNAAAIGGKEFCYDEENTTGDPFYRSFEQKSLERVVTNQSNKLKRIAVIWKSCSCGLTVASKTRKIIYTTLKKKSPRTESLNSGRF